MSNYNTIKELVIDSYVSNGEMPEYDALTEKVMEHFPHSAWQRTHYSWYKSQINTGKIAVPSEGSIEIENIDEEIAESIESRLSLEKDLHSYLSSSVDLIEPGLIIEPNGIEYSIEAGRIDILAKDREKNLVVIELKAGKAGDAALGQLLGYIGCLSSNSNSGNEIRGILVASDFEPRVVFAAKALSNVSLCKYAISFSFQEVT